MFIMKTLLKLARKFQLKYGQSGLGDLFNNPGPYQSPNWEESEQEEEDQKSEEEIQKWYQGEAARKSEQERQQQEKQKSEAGKTPFTAQDAAAIVNQFLPEMRKKFPNLKGVTFNFMSSGEVSAGSQDPKLAGSIRTQYSASLAMALKQYLINNKKIFKDQKVSYSI